MALMGAKDSIWPYGRIFWHFEYDANDHDDGEKTFLGVTGNFNGDDVIRIIAKQHATSKFVARHLYNFFVADEVPVPSWEHVTPRDEAAIQLLSETYVKSNYSIKEMLRVLFNSDFFKVSRFTKVKSPAELVLGTLRSTKDFYQIDGADTSVYDVMEESGFMGQKLTNPPSVEGWHTGEEWITSGALVDRVNFASRYLSDPENVGVGRMLTRVDELIGGNDGPEQFVNACLSVLGEIEVSKETYESLMVIAEHSYSVNQERPQMDHEAVMKIFQIVSSSREFQLC